MENTLIQRRFHLEREVAKRATSLPAFDQQASRQQFAGEEAGDISSSQHSLTATRVDRVIQVPLVLVILALAARELYSVATVCPASGWSFIRCVELLAALVLFMISAPAVIILNKHILWVHKFTFPIFLASLGDLLLMVVTHCAVATGLHKLEVPKLEWRWFLRLVVPIVCLNFVSHKTGMWAYLFVSLPLIQILKSMTIVAVCVLAYFIVNEPLSLKLVIGVLVIAAGSAMCAYFDQGASQSVKHTAIANVIGIMLCLVGAFCEAGKAVFCQVIMQSLNVFDSAYWSTPLSTLLACIFVAAIELRSLVHYPFTWSLAGLLLLNAVLTGLVILSNFWLTKLIGALSLKVLVQSRTIGLVLVAAFYFHESCTSMQYLGYIIALIGMWIFSSAKRALREAAGAGQPPGKAHDGVQEAADEGQPPGRAHEAPQEAPNRGQPPGRADEGAQAAAEQGQAPGEAHEGAQEAANEGQSPGEADDAAHASGGGPCRAG